MLIPWYLICRKAWLRNLSPDNLVLGLIIANTAVFMLWRLANSRFMMNNFTVSTQMCYTLLILCDMLTFLFLFCISKKEKEHIKLKSWLDYCTSLTWFVPWLTFSEQISVENLKSLRLHTLITSAFSHFDTGHIMHNMIGLYFFGSHVCSSFLIHQKHNFDRSSYLTCSKYHIKMASFFIINIIICINSPDYITMFDMCG